VPKPYATETLGGKTVTLRQFHDTGVSYWNHWGNAQIVNRMTRRRGIFLSVPLESWGNVRPPSMARRLHLRLVCTHFRAKFLILGIRNVGRKGIETMARPKGKDMGITKTVSLGGNRTVQLPVILVTDNGNMTFKLTHEDVTVASGNPEVLRALFEDAWRERGNRTYRERIAVIRSSKLEDSAISLNVRYVVVNAAETANGIFVKYADGKVALYSGELLPVGFENLPVLA